MECGDVGLGLRGTSMRDCAAVHPLPSVNLVLWSLHSPVLLVRSSSLASRFILQFCLSRRRKKNSHRPAITIMGNIFACIIRSQVNVLDIGSLSHNYVKRCLAVRGSTRRRTTVASAVVRFMKSMLKRPTLLPHQHHHQQEQEEEQVTQADVAGRRTMLMC